MDAPAAASEAETAPSAALTIPEDAPVVAFLGDSVGAGLHLAEDQAFPALVQQRLSAKDLPFRLVSSCESGRTTAGGLAAVDWVLRSQPDLFVIAIGANDGLRGIELAEVEANLRAIIERVRAAGPRILLLGVRIPPNYGDYAGKFDAIYPALAKEFELEFVPFYMEGVGGVPEMNLPDGLHPTPKGQERLADNVEPSVESALRELLSED